MKFSEQLRKSSVKDYLYYYISYDDLSSFLSRTVNREWTEKDEVRFLTLLEAELDKVYTFQRVKSNELTRRIKDTEREITMAVSMPTDEDDFYDLEDDLSEVIAEVHDLGKFSRLNHVGFQKILKKHDKYTGRVLGPIFSARLNAKPFFKDNYNNLVLKLSKLYEILRTRGLSGDTGVHGAQYQFVRQTTKYWVHPDNLTEVKLLILKHLPVLVFNVGKEFETQDSAISTVYYDNQQLQMYKARLEKREGAEAIRVRWYGGMEADHVFVERKTHREAWTGEDSVKARFAIQERHVTRYMAGKYPSKLALDKAQFFNVGQTSEALEGLAKEIQYTSVSDNLRPALRTFYNRTAFQLPGDARVRVSLDTELCMIREDDFDELDRARNNWRRMDIGIDYPFKQLPEEDIERFPYAVLEIKLQTQLDQEPPQWVLQLVSSHLVEAVPRFSKYAHGVATLFPKQVDQIPYWIPQMGVDIRKPERDFGIERPFMRYGSTSDDDEEDDLAVVRFDRTATRRSFHEATESMPLLLPRVRDCGGIEVSVGPGHRIAVPVTIEPKVYFSTERTFLAWIQVGIILTAIAGGLLNFGDQVGVSAGAGFSAIAILTVVYALWVYLQRVRLIRKRSWESYEAKVGPTMICMGLAAATGINFWLHYSK